MKVYLAGGMRQEWRKQIIAAVEGVTFLDPTAHGLNSPEAYTFADLLAVKECDLLVGYMEKDNPSGIGLACEVGYARGLGKPVLLVNDQPNNRYFQFVAFCGAAVVPDIETVIKILQWDGIR